MKEQEIIKAADTMKQLNTYFGGEKVLDLRNLYWRVGSFWIDTAKWEDFKHSNQHFLVWMEDCPECYVEFEKITVALLEKGGVEWLCIFDNDFKRYT